ncbi:LA_2272/LA_2273 family lipoprotein [Leptospira stimsonii]|uniref:Lipoprotein n=1 Tax=Leptospira stimsonii TaxID=2202203 RepID=A0ABY2MV48_9LEPT|nr:hypothetical protein [Leptospira stimsonii]TGK25350.1 hypothetical protein EHO98_02820 [Leptospira stimsonii]TGM08769.1 hypothetical protein EHQ90_22005 [Leptospira stimsonii]
MSQLSKLKPTFIVKSSCTLLFYRILIWIGFLSFVSNCAIGGIKGDKPLIKIPKDSNMEVLRINLMHGETNNLFGLNLGVSNEVRSDLTGIQIGILNRAMNGTVSIQIGVLNRLDGVGYAIRIGLYNRDGRFSMDPQILPVYLIGGFTIGALNVASDGGTNIGLMNLIAGGFNVGLINLLTHGVTIGLINHGFDKTFSLGIINFCEYGQLPVMILANYCFLRRD